MYRVRSGGPRPGTYRCQPAAAVAANAPGAADGPVSAERAIRDGERRPEQVREAATQAVGPVATGAARAADGLVPTEGAARDRGRCPTLAVDRAADALAREGAARVPGAADGPVVGEGTGAYG